MMHRPGWVLVLLCVLAGAAHGESEAPFTDPFAYCAAVKDIDAPDARYRGPAVPPAVQEGLVSLDLIAKDAPPEARETAAWRCMNGKLYICTFGANLPCNEKADTSREPSAAMTSFCNDEPDADFIPAYVTGRATVYAWRCRDGAAVVERSVATPDVRGFLSDIWYALPAPGK